MSDPDQYPVRTVQETYTTPGPAVPGIMIPEFEIVNLSDRAYALRRHRVPSAGAAWACFGISAGVAGSALGIYAADQHIKYTIAFTLWALAGLFFVLTFVSLYVRSRMKGMHTDAVKQYCDELEMVVRRYGGARAQSVVGRMYMEGRLEESSRGKKRLYSDG